MSLSVPRFFIAWPALSLTALVFMADTRSAMLRLIALPIEGRWDMVVQNAAGTQAVLAGGTTFGSKGAGRTVGGENQWRAVSGILQNTRGGGNLVTTREFTDFRLQLEFRYPKDGNSGVYLRGRYEVQIADTPGPEPLIDGLGSIYGFLTPNEYANRPAGEWQAFDVRRHQQGRKRRSARTASMVATDGACPCHHGLHPGYGLGPAAGFSCAARVRSRRPPTLATRWSSSTAWDLNPKSIERIKGVKGAAGMSFYGSEPANGVTQLSTQTH